MQAVNLYQTILTLQSLPIHAQQTIADFVDFLKNKYANELDQSFLDTRKMHDNQINSLGNFSC